MRWTMSFTYLYITGTKLNAKNKIDIAESDHPIIDLAFIFG